jgi:hypothetical protein
LLVRSSLRSGLAAGGRWLGEFGGDGVARVFNVFGGEALAAFLEAQRVYAAGGEGLGGVAGQASGRGTMVAGGNARAPEFQSYHFDNVGANCGMQTQRFVFGLTVLNVLVLMSVLFRAQSAGTPEVAPVLRGRALEIVDDRGRVRAMIKVFTATPDAKMPDGTMGYPETVLLRLINSKGAPNVKIAATEDGSAVSLGGESNPTDIQLLARGTNTSIKLVNKDGRERRVKPE